MSDTANPYASPLATVGGNVDTTNGSLGQRRFRIALLIGAVAPGYEYVRFLHGGLQNRAWAGDMGGFFVILALAGSLALFVAIAAGWCLGYPAIRLVAHIIRRAFAKNVPVESWNNVTDRSLAVLPYAAVLGVLTWLVYSIGRFGGWPGDVIFGTVGNLIGAWCYLTLGAGWYKLYASPDGSGELLSELSSPESRSDG
jgi:hypothetical protein